MYNTIAISSLKWMNITTSAPALLIKAHKQTLDVNSGDIVGVLTHTE